MSASTRIDNVWAKSGWVGESTVCGYTMRYLWAVYADLSKGVDPDAAIEAALEYLRGVEGRRLPYWNGYTAHETLQLVQAFKTVREMRYRP